MIAAASSLVFWYWVPVIVFLFFCKGGQSSAGREKEKGHTVLPAFFKALARSLSRWLPRVMLCCLDEKCEEGKKVGGVSPARGGKPHPLFPLPTSIYRLFLLHFFGSISASNLARSRAAMSEH